MRIAFLLLSRLSSFTERGSHMPGTYESDRNGKNDTQRKGSLLNRARNASIDVRSWSEYFSDKGIGVYTTAKPGVSHVALHSFAKIAVYTTTSLVGGIIALFGGTA